MSIYRVIRRNAAPMPWTPTILGSALRAWYDPSDSSTLFTNANGGSENLAGNGSAIRRISDKSGNNFFLRRDSSTGLTRAVNAINGLDALQATGSGYINTQLLKPFGESSLAGLTVIHVRKTNPTTQPDSVDWSVAYSSYTGATGYDPRASAMEARITDRSSGGPSGWVNPVAGFQRWIDGFRFPAYRDNVPRDSAVVMSSRWDGSGRTMSFWLNGVGGSGGAHITQGSQVWDWDNNANLSNFQVFQSVTPSSEKQISIGIEYGAAELHGYLGEYLFCNAALSDSDRQKAEGYLAHKWGLAANLPVGHPYKNAAPTA